MSTIKFKSTMSKSGSFLSNPNPNSFDNNSKKRSEMGSGSVVALNNVSDTGSEETNLSTSEGDDSSWISYFCGLRGNELLCKVDEAYIQDAFNLCGLQAQVSLYDQALDMILGSDAIYGGLDVEKQKKIRSDAELLYGLIHARYIITGKGLSAMNEKYQRTEFGRCPRFYCEGQPCLPVGTSDIPHNGSVKIYCPKCEDVYFPKCKYQSNMDGSFVGTTFPHLYLMTYPSDKPSEPPSRYVPRVFGFKLHKSSG